jgi:two-component system cell cycle response regulator CtrA
LPTVHGCAQIRSCLRLSDDLIAFDRDERELSEFTAGRRELHSLFTAFVNTSFPRVKPGKEGQPVRVLLIEDDVSIAQSIELMLKCENCNVYTTDLGEEGVDLSKLYDYDIILLDLNLPDMSGYEVLRSLRVAKVKTPILILSGLAGIQDKVKGLGFGADDYLTKPFHKDELVARIHAIVRRSKGHAESVVTCGDLTVRLDAQQAEIAGRPVSLTGKEYGMLELLALRKGSTLTKEMFLNQLYGGMDEPEHKIIDVFICKLRKKLAEASGGQHYIETVWGRGYVLRELEPQQMAS